MFALSKRLFVEVPTRERGERRETPAPQHSTNRGNSTASRSPTYTQKRRWWWSAGTFCTYCLQVYVDLRTVARNQRAKRRATKPTVSVQLQKRNIPNSVPCTKRSSRHSKHETHTHPPQTPKKANACFRTKSTNQKFWATQPGEISVEMWRCRI